MLKVVAFFLCIGAGTVGGVFFAFSTFVMKALAQVPPREGVRAMQRINVVVLNPLFLGPFFGTAAVSVGGLAAGYLAGWGPASGLLICGALLYLGGSFLVTLRFNVPRNERLGGMDAASSQAEGYWPEYVKGWTRWNHVRTAASIAAAACAAGALAS
jgi:uncharacterized membrane protein